VKRNISVYSEWDNTARKAVEAIEEFEYAGHKFFVHKADWDMDCSEYLASELTSGFITGYGETPEDAKADAIKKLARTEQSVIDKKIADAIATHGKANEEVAI
jgi:hypothetical protein